MAWNLTEALDYYKRMGAPADQNALISLLTEVQEEHGGSIPKSILPHIAGYYGTKEALLAALIRRIPRLKLSDTHTLELCAGPNCGKHTALAAFAESLPGITVKFIPCQRMCGKGPNIRWNGKLHNRATEELIRKLITEGEK